MKASIALVATASLLAGAGCSFGDDEDAARDERAAQGRPQPTLVDSTAVEGGPPRERSVLTRVVGGMEKTTLTQVTIVASDAGAENGAAVAVTFTSGGRPSVRRQWEAWVVAGGFSRRLAAARLPATVDARGDQGSFTARPRVRGQPDPRPLSRTDVAAITRRLRAAVTRSGADIVRIEIHRPYGAAVVLSIAAEDPARFLKNRLRGVMNSVFAHRRRLEGIYLAVLDERRRVVMEWGSWTRNPAGSYWVRRDLANCSPIRQSEPKGTAQPPPCPV